MEHRKSTTHEERYIHIRDLNHVKYQGATVFARKEQDGNWFIGISLCWKLDQFSKAIGRNNARRKYFNSTPSYLGKEFNYEKIQELVNQKINQTKH